MPIVSELILSLMLTASLSAGAPLSAPPGLAVSLPAITAQAQQLHTPLMILHAGGVTPEGVTGSNSLEALEHSYENGFRLLELDFSADEDVVCIAENDACGVDAIQVLLGCSVGKGNLLFHLRGKQAFSFYNRKTGKAVRLVLRPTPAEYQTKEERFRYLQDAAPASLFDVKPAVLSLPERARLFQSHPCDGCGEVTGANWLRLAGDRKLCVDCYHTYDRFHV